MGKRQMGPFGPIRGRREPPPWPMAPREGPTLHMAHPPSPPLWFSTTWEVGGGWQPPLAYIRRGRPPFFHHLIDFFLSLFLLPRADPPCLGFALGWEFSTISRTSLYRSLDPNPSSFRCSPGSEPGGNIGCTVHV